MITAVTAPTAAIPRASATLVRPRIADCSSNPTSTKRAPLSRKVDIDQTATVVCFAGGLDHARPCLAYHESADDDGQHTGCVDHLGEQERGEWSQDGHHVPEQRVIQPMAYLHHQPSGGKAGRGTARVGEQEQPCEVPAAEMLFAHGDTNSDAVDDQCGAIVDQTLGAQHGQIAPRQRASERSYRRRIGRRDGRSQRPCRRPGMPNACAAAATAAAVAITSTVLAKMMPRRFLRISRRDMLRLSQYNSAGKRNSIASRGRCALRK